MIFGNSPVVVQNMFGKTPKSLNAVDVVFRFLVHHVLRVIDRMMLPETLEGVIALERVRVVDRTFPRFLSQKVGRTTENVVSSCNHKDILVSSGYDSN